MRDFEVGECQIFSLFSALLCMYILCGEWSLYPFSGEERKLYAFIQSKTVSWYLYRMDIFQSKQKAFPWSSDALLCDRSKKIIIIIFTKQHTKKESNETLNLVNIPKCSNHQHNSCSSAGMISSTIQMQIFLWWYFSLLKAHTQNTEQCNTEIKSNGETQLKLQEEI